ncbi:Arm DNA-binding domain-containing protein [Caldibacillus thermolactis]|uniref:Arm DNA-binding domain-containing protein n=1 Tax=Pallidibacillus thermolactis TaxID=251051 RepID=A0ABT2WLD2_9BACI|nr:Arm DNA-binding domain-containing protein [Pallidibacillus thermolactis]MCU9595499.1 Arm DNA-binding domain-containing protein [Pallidibacillus thermolactis]MED1674810.1 Arm DNA-binding domain-containing protein [Pallidibacillus thermolactis subsp. kokeshiiformis]
MDPETGKRNQITRNGFETKRDTEFAANEILYDGTYIEEKDIVF